MNSVLTALIVDDEPLARSRIRRLLEKEPDVVVCAESGNGDEAVKALFAHQPNLIFLDIEMPGLNGFDVLRQITPPFGPCCIVVTAYPQYAIRAFEYEALDYVVKPFRNQRFYAALERARRHVALRERQAANPEGSMVGERDPRIAIDLYGSSILLEPPGIQWIQADGNYVKIRALDSVYYKRATLVDMEKKLQPAGFVRVHRSTLLNRHFVAHLKYLGNNEFEINMSDGRSFRSGRTYKTNAQSLL